MAPVSVLVPVRSRLPVTVTVTGSGYSGLPVTGDGSLFLVLALAGGTGRHRMPGAGRSPVLPVISCLCWCIHAPLGGV